MATLHEWLDLASALRRRGRDPLPERLDASSVILLDTEIGSENSGDHIIMRACDDVCREIFGTADLERIPTHPEAGVSPREDAAPYLKILCGTNILYKDMYGQRQLVLPHDLHSYKDVCLLGVGLSDIGIEGATPRYTRMLYKALLGTSCLHSVRDEKARRFLVDLGYENVLNTACPTMWGLSEELQRSIPRDKADTVVTSVTDYCFDAERDAEMLRVLRESYDRVIIWVQGSHDLDWCLERIVDTSEFELVGPDVSELDRVLVSGEVDYVGTRLHAGIRALNRRVRSLIVTVDNRARQIGADTNLPVIEREDAAAGGLASWVERPYECDIRLPERAIARWKAQFSS